MATYDVVRDLDGNFAFAPKQTYDVYGTATPFGLINNGRVRVLDLPLPVVMYYRNPDALGMVMAPVGKSILLEGLDTGKCRDSYYVERRRKDTLMYDDFSSGRASIIFVLVNSNGHRLFSTVTCSATRTVADLVFDCMNRYNALYAKPQPPRLISPKTEPCKIAV